MFSVLKGAPAWKKYTTADGGGGDSYQLCEGHHLGYIGDGDDDTSRADKLLI